MELVVKDTVVTIKHKDPNSDETIILNDATVVTNTKDPNDRNAIKIKPLESSTMIIEFGERRIL